MRNSRLINLLRCIEKNELKELKRQLKTKTTSTSSNLIELYYIITQFHPNYDSEKLDKEKVFKTLFKKSSKKSRKLDDLIFQMSKQVEQFLICKRLENDELTATNILLKELSKRNFSAVFIYIVIRIIRPIWYH